MITWVISERLLSVSKPETNLNLAKRRHHKKDFTSFCTCNSTNNEHILEKKAYLYLRIRCSLAPNSFLKHPDPGFDSACRLSSHRTKYDGVRPTCTPKPLQGIKYSRAKNIHKHPRKQNPFLVSNTSSKSTNTCTDLSLPGSTVLSVRASCSRDSRSNLESSREYRSKTHVAHKSIAWPIRIVKLCLGTSKEPDLLAVPGV